MKKISLVVTLVFFIYCAKSQNAAAGEKIFQSTCSVCHTIGKGKVVGPDLVKISDRRNEKWLISWIKSSQTMIKNNDPVAVKLFNENNKMVMPDAALSDVQIKDVLAFIKKSSGGATANKPPAKGAKKG